MKNHILYFADPMCSWCWGFAPVIQSVQQTYSQQFPIHIFLGGLGRDTHEPLDANGKKSIREHWEHVHQQTNQPFNFEFFERDGFIYNTELACRAVVTARRLYPDRALDFLFHLHHAFYKQLRDVTDPLTLFDLAEEFGFDSTAFKTDYNSSEARQETETDFEATKGMGVRGYPTLCIGNPENGYSVMTVGYRPWQEIEAGINTWIKSTSN